MEASWGVPAGASGHDWGAPWLSPVRGWERGCARLWGEAERCVRGWGWRVAAGTTSSPKGWHSLERIFSLCPAIGNGGISFSYLGFSSWNHFYYFLISFTTISLSGSLFTAVVTFSFVILLSVIHLKISSNFLCLLHRTSHIPSASLLFSFLSSLPSVSWFMPPYRRLGMVLLACTIATTALDSLHLRGLPLLSSQFFQLMAGRTEEGLYSLSHNLPL